MKDIAIIGAGGFGREVKTLIEQINEFEKLYNIVGFYDDDIDQPSSINGIPYLGSTREINKQKSPLSIALGIGEPKAKEKIIKSIVNKFITYPTLIHPKAIISNNNIKIGYGSIICAGNIITCDIKIGAYVTLNLCCTVGHDTEIGDFSSFMPSVNISGEVSINNNVYVGTGATIINQLSIGENTIIGAGAVVSKSLPPNCTAVGIPAKPIKFHN